MPNFLSNLFQYLFASASESAQPPPAARRASLGGRIEPDHLESVALTRTPSAPEGERGAVVQSLLATNTQFQGDLDAVGGIKIEGTVAGSVRVSEGVLVLTGTIRGDVFAETVFIDGNVDGSLCATRVLMGSNGHVQGTVRYAEMHWQQGARIDGEVRQVSAADLVNAIANPLSRAQPQAQAQSHVQHNAHAQHNPPTPTSTQPIAAKTREEKLPPLTTSNARSMRVVPPHAPIAATTA
jgi:cytoskeletal protein CcmA (bactofilin family)